MKPNTAAPPSIVLHPRFAEAGKLRVWVGVRHVSAPPPLQWRLNGALATPSAIYPLTSARPAPLLGTATLRVFTGIYEFAGLDADSPYVVAATAQTLAASVSHEIRVRTLPSGLSSDGES